MSLQDIFNKNNKNKTFTSLKIENSGLRFFNEYMTLENEKLKEKNNELVKKLKNINKNKKEVYKSNKEIQTTTLYNNNYDINIIIKKIKLNNEILNINKYTQTDIIDYSEYYII